MKSRQFTLGLMALILTGLFNFKAIAQCCVAPDNPEIGPSSGSTTLQWQRIQKARCTTPVKYRVEWREVGDSTWTSRIVTAQPDATYGFKSVTPSVGNQCGIITFQWRVQGICSSTNKTAFVAGPDFSILHCRYGCTVPQCLPRVTTSSTSDASSQGEFTVTAYPNPVAGELKLSGNLKAGGRVNIQIINSVGETVLRQDYNFNSGDFNTDIDVSRLPPGVYLVVVNDKTDKATLSIIKQ